MTALTNDLANVNDEVSRLRQERDRLDQQLRQQGEGRKTESGREQPPKGVERR